MLFKTRSTHKPEPTALDTLRAEKDRFFGGHPQSPLTPEQKRHFKGLNYFPENSALRLEVTVDKFAQRDKVQMQTTTGGTQTYVRYGKFKFTVDGQAAELTLFSNEHGFFLPFADTLAGTETYGAGRYLEPEPLGGDKFRVDFNLAYNPYCASSDRWACPVTPRENRIKVAIRAGEKVFHG
jgi:uncharacterized protein (DUF1684 family)